MKNKITEIIKILFTKSKEKQVDCILETCHYLQSQDNNGDYMEIIKEITDGKLTIQQAIKELESILSTLVSEFNLTNDKYYHDKIKKIA